MDSQRRIWLVATGTAGCVAGCGAAAPFVGSLAPSAKERAEGGPMEVDISDVAPGEKKTVLWRGQPIWFLHRTPEMLATLKHTDSLVADPMSRGTDYPTPPWAQNRWRSIRPEMLVVVGICTHLGCSPVNRFRPGPQPSLPADWQGGFLCPCHGSEFDLAARVFKNMPAPANLPVPPYRFVGKHKIVLGEAPTST